MMIRFSCLIVSFVVAVCSYGTDLKPDQVKRHSAAIDRLIESALKANGQAPNPPLSDALFLRRAYLAVVGRIPSLTEIREFEERKGPDKRLQLIQRLVGSYGYVSHQYNYWADVLRVKFRLQGLNGQLPGRNYSNYIKDTLEKNTPYDAWVRELLSASGSLYEENNGALGYYIRDRGMPLDNMANTTRIFLGTRMECAQCHDHPFDKWTQKDFYGMAAFTYGNWNFREAPANAKKSIGTYVRSLRNDSANSRSFRIARSLGQVLATRFTEAGKGVIALPDDYQYEDGSPGDVIEAKALFGPEVDIKAVPKAWAEKSLAKQRKKKNKKYTFMPYEDNDSRRKFGEWVTHPDNPRFTTVIVNRLWKQVFGRALIEPIDDIRDTSTASIPELQTYLETLIKSLQYDMKAFNTILYNTKAFQRAATKGDVPVDTPYFFPGPVLQRMSAEQMWDSHLVLRFKASIDRRDSHVEPFNAFYDGMKTDIDDKGLLNAFKDAVTHFQTASPGGLAQLAVLEDQLKRMEMNDKARQSLLQKIADFRSNPENMDRRKIRTFQKSMNQLRNKHMTAEAREARSLLSKQGYKNDLQRASELGQRVGAGHFIRRFGGSDRDVIEGANRDPSITQALDLLNGCIESLLSDGRTNLVATVTGATSVEERIDLIYRSVLARFPTDPERQAAVQDVSHHGPVGYHDLVWVLMNSHEYKFIP